MSASPACRALLGLVLAIAAAAAAAQNPTRPVQDEVFYFVLPDRFHNGDSSNDTGGYPGDRSEHGFDPTDKAYYHGGDIAGLTAKLDYLAEMGMTAIWMGPIFKNKPVQTDANGTSAAYHGYWITDFTQVDPHLGTNEELKTLVREAHARGIRVFFDIIANHTADVIRYRQCHDPSYEGSDKEGPAAECRYRTKAEYPYTTIGGPDGAPINEGFAGDEVQTEENFAKLTDPRWAYEPYLPAGEESVKVPAWLNDPIYYHNRGESTYSGENSLYGDFVSLDDLFTEHPRVVEGMVEIYQYWIREFRIDGFRVDTVKHVNLEFWQRFTPATIEYAREQGIPEFFVFGEVYDATPEFLSRYTTRGRLPAVLDFGFQGAVASWVSTPKASDELKVFFAQDDYYIDADSDAYLLPTFIGNHDMGRIGHFIRLGAREDADGDELLRRSRLGHALLYFARGMPVVYFGDEQGFTGDGNDQDAREDMFPSQVASYNDNPLLGTEASTAHDNFDPEHPLYRALRGFGEIYRMHPALRRGVQVHRYSSDEPGVYAFSRIDTGARQEYLLAFNNALQPRTARLTPYARGGYTAVHPAGGPPRVAGPDIELAVPPLDFVIYRADAPIPVPDEAPEPRFTDPAGGGVLIKDQFVTVALNRDELAEVAFSVRVGDGAFRPLGTDTNPPYRVFFRAGDHADGTALTFRAQASDYAGQARSAQVEARVDRRLPRVRLHYQNGNGRGSAFGIASTGAMLFPRALAGGTMEFPWPEGADGVSLLFESRDGGHFVLDRPLYLDLTDTVMPLSEDREGELVAELHVDDQHRVRGEATPAAELPDAPPATLPAGPAPEPPLPETVHLRGGMNAWQDTHPMHYVGRHTYHLRVPLAADTIEFKFADATWQSLNVGAPVGPHGASRGSNPGNLRMRVPPGEGGLYDAHFFAFPEGEGHRFLYRFERVAEPLGRTMYLRGRAVGTWDALPENALEYLGDGIYRLERALRGGDDLEFKIADRDWSAGTNLGVPEGTRIEPGEAVALVDNGSNVRVSVPAARYRFVLDASDPEAPLLTIERTGEADVGPFGKALYLKGTMNDWANMVHHRFAYQGDGGFRLVAELAAGRHEFKIADADWSDGSDLGDGAIQYDRPVRLRNRGGNIGLEVPEAGVHRFLVDATDPAAPVLEVSPLGPYGVGIYLRGSMNGWVAEEAFRLRYAGGSRYRASIELAAGQHELKVAGADWAAVNLGAGAEAELAPGTQRVLSGGADPGNLRVSIEQGGAFTVRLDAGDPERPVLTLAPE